MDDEDWRLLHGLPTYHCGSWLPRQKKSLCEQPGCASFKNRTKKLRLGSAAAWKKEVRRQGSEYECEVCVQERARRRRVLPAEGEDTREGAEAEATDIAALKA